MSYAVYFVTNLKDRIESFLDVPGWILELAQVNLKDRIERFSTLTFTSSIFSFCPNLKDRIESPGSCHGGTAAMYVRI